MANPIIPKGSASQSGFGDLGGGFIQVGTAVFKILADGSAVPATLEETRQVAERAAPAIQKALHYTATVDATPVARDLTRLEGMARQSNSVLGRIQAQAAGDPGGEGRRATESLREQALAAQELRRSLAPAPGGLLGRDLNPAASTQFTRSAQESIAALRGVNTAASSAGSGIQGAFAAAGRTVSAAGQEFTDIWSRGLAGVTAGLIGFQAAVRVFDAIGEQGQKARQAQFALNKSFGEGAQAAEEFAQRTTSAIGRSIADIELADAELQRTGNVVGLTRQQVLQLGLLASDIAAVSGRSQEQAGHAIAAAFLGQPRGLDILGIPATQAVLKSSGELAAAREQFADKTELAQKSQGLFNLIMKESVPLQGAASERALGAAGAFDRLGAATDNLAARIGKGTFLTDLAGGLTEAAESADRLLQIMALLSGEVANPAWQQNRQQLAAALNSMPRGPAPPNAPPDTILGLSVFNPNYDPSGGRGSTSVPFTAEMIAELQRRAVAGDEAAVHILQVANAELERQKKLREDLADRSKGSNLGASIAAATEGMTAAGRTLAEQASRTVSAFRSGINAQEDLTKPPNFQLGPERDPKNIQAGLDAVAAAAAKEREEANKAADATTRLRQSLEGGPAGLPHIITIAGDIFKQISTGLKLDESPLAKALRERQSTLETIKNALESAKPEDRAALEKRFREANPELTAAALAEIAQDPNAPIKGAIKAQQEADAAATKAKEKQKAITAELARESEQGIRNQEQAQLEALQTQGRTEATAAETASRIERDRHQEVSDHLRDQAEARALLVSQQERQLQLSGQLAQSERSISDAQAKLAQAQTGPGTPGDLSRTTGQRAQQIREAQKAVDDATRQAGITALSAAGAGAAGSLSDAERAALVGRMQAQLAARTDLTPAERLAAQAILSDAQGSQVGLSPERRAAVAAALGTAIQGEDEAARRKEQKEARDEERLNRDNTRRQEDLQKKEREDLATQERVLTKRFEVARQERETTAAWERINFPEGHDAPPVLTPDNAAAAAPAPPPGAAGAPGAAPPAPVGALAGIGMPAVNFYGPVSVGALGWARKLAEQIVTAVQTVQAEQGAREP